VPTRKTATRKSAEARRADLLDATVRVVARKGFSGATTRDVATEAGVSHSLLHHHFPNRDELVAQAFEAEATRHIEGLRGELAAQRDALGRVKLMVSEPEIGHYLIWIDAWSEAPRNEALQRTLLGHQRLWERLYADVVAEAVAAGAIADTGERPLDAGRRILATTDGLTVQLFCARSISPATYRRELRRAWGLTA
jgi:AcrR family transcriptional regulator